MRWLAHRAFCSALVTLALLASGEPLLAQEPDAEARANTTSDSSGVTRTAPIERRAPNLRDAPPGFERWSRELRPGARRILQRRLRRMPEPQREEFFRRWERMSVSERRELRETIGPTIERRRPRALPPRLRTPALRERLERMSPEERQQFFARVRDWREMKPAERHRMRERLAKFGALPDAEQRALVEQKFSRKSPEERAKILGELRDASQQLRAHTPPARD